MAQLSGVADKTLVYHILGSIDSLKSSVSGAEDTAKLEAAIANLEAVFGVSIRSPEDFKEHSYHPVTFSQIFDKGVAALHPRSFQETLIEAESNPKFNAFYGMVKEKGYYDGVEPDSLEYLQRHSKLIQKFNEKVSDSPEKQAEEKEALAEQKKSQGNAAISSKDYESAVQYYTEALDLSPSGPNSHIYFCNRAAAYCQLNEYAEAVADCEAAVALCKDYVKAYSRLGLSHFYLNNYAAAVKAYENAVELEPDNEGSKKSLKQARKKLEEQRKAKSVAPPTSSSGAVPPAGGMPDMASMLGDPSFMPGMLNNPMMKDAMDKVGGQAGLAQLMKDPQMMAMAQKMMQNPEALKQAMSMFGGAGGMPDMSMLAGMMGGGAAGAGKKKGPFKGFEEDA